MKIGQKLAKIGPLDPRFYFFRPRPLARLCSIFFSGAALVANGVPEKI